jgi:hypothetical protein
VLGCLISMKGIKANRDKINAIVHMKPAGSRKEVQRLTGRIAALNRLMAKIAERSLPFFKVLRGSGMFEWGPEQQEAFDALKEYTKAANISKSAAGSITHSVCFDNTHCSQWSSRRRKRDIERGQKVIAPSPNIFYLRSSHWLKKILLRDGKNMLCCSHEREEALALL